MYGPTIRIAPWAWGAVYHASDSHLAMRFLRRTLFRLAAGPVANAVATVDPAAIVSFHSLTTEAAVNASRRGSHNVPVITVVTDLVTTHVAWRYDQSDIIVAPSNAVLARCHLDGIGAGRCMEIGLPVALGFQAGQPSRDERAELRRRLGVDEHRFLVLVTGGSQGSGNIARQAVALIEGSSEIQVVAICGRNRRLERQLAARSSTTEGRLLVTGFVDNMADWMRCADVVVARAGPGTVAEATCCGAALVLTSHLPGQEAGNIELVVEAGAGRHAPTVRDLVREISELRRDPEALEAMRGASARLGRPHAAAKIAALVTEYASATASIAAPQADESTASGAARRPAEPLISSQHGPV